MNDETKNPRRRRWWQFGLRGLLLLVLLIALGLLACREYLKPYWRQQQTVVLVEKLGGTCQTVEVDHWWLKLFGGGYNVTQVNLADCDDPDAYLADVAELPAIAALAVGGPAFTDGDLRHLERVKTLRDLLLDTTSVTAEGLSAFRAAVPEAEVYQTQRRAAAALKKVGCDVDDAPFYSTSFETHERAISVFGLSKPLELLPRIDHVQLRGSVGDAEMAQLSELHELRTIRAGHTKVTNAGLEKIRGLTNLVTLEVGYTRLTDAGLAHLAGMKKLLHLDLTETHLTDAGLPHLKALTQLRTLRLPREWFAPKITRKGIEDLQRALPRCDISR